MFKFAELTIRKKIFLTTLFIIALISMVKMYEFSFLERLEKDIGSLISQNWEIIDSVKDIESQFNLSNASLSYYTVTKDKGWLKIEAQSEKDFFISLNKIKKAYPNNQDFVKLYTNLEKNSRSFFQEVDKIIKVNPEGLNTFLQKNNNKATQIIYLCKELEGYSQRLTGSNDKLLSMSFNNAKFFNLISTLLLLSLIVILIFVQLSFLLTPLADLVNGVKLIWAGDTDHKINVNTKDEMGELAKAFNLMAESIHREQKRLFEKATTDEMTGLFNFRYFQSVIEKEHEKALRFNHVMSLIIMDVDFFKFYNDNNGHQAGDDVLRTVATVVKNSCRDIDIPARYGGEEFVVVLPNTNLESAAKVAERIRKAVETTQMLFQEKQPNKNLTISLGVSSFPLNANNVKDLVESADSALYEAKSSGKNKVCLAKAPVQPVKK